ncbi:MAG TPA: EthD domain-containing protein [Dehalococcoidia bacterium]|nr:EthD domain-containing protein [Dehalococcoidia bacterium]
MIKLTFCLRRLPQMSLEECQKYWLETHGPLVRKHAAALRIRRYVQVHRTESPINEAMRLNRQAGEPFDGVAELWWDSIQDIVEATVTPEGREASRVLLEDERRFIDFTRSALWVGEEHPIVE